MAVAVGAGGSVGAVVGATVGSAVGGGGAIGVGAAAGAHALNSKAIDITRINSLCDMIFLLWFFNEAS